MVSEVGLYLHLFNKENIWSNPHASSHADKYNNSVNRIISKKRRERRSKERFFNLSSSTVVFPHSYKNYSASTRNPATPSNSAYRINSSTRIPQEILQLQGSSHAGSFQQLFPVSPSILHGRIRLPDLPTAFQGHTAQAGFQ